MSPYSSSAVITVCRREHITTWSETRFTPFLKMKSSCSCWANRVNIFGPNFQDLYMFGSEENIKVILLHHIFTSTYLSLTYGFFYQYMKKVFNFKANWSGHSVDQLTSCHVICIIMFKKQFSLQSISNSRWPDTDINLYISQVLVLCVVLIN